MAFSVTIHYDNSPGFTDPHVWIWYDASVATQEDIAATDVDASVRSFTWKRSEIISVSSSNKVRATPGRGKATGSTATTKRLR